MGRRAGAAESKSQSADEQLVKKLKPLPKKMPRFSSYEEEANFWDTHDTSRLLRNSKPARLTFTKPLKHALLVEMDGARLRDISALAAKRGMSPFKLINAMLEEKLREEFRKNTRW